MIPPKRGRDEKTFVEARTEEKEKMGILMDEKYAIHVNLISQTEMKAHTKEMRSEIDHKFVDCLMATGCTRAEAIKHVREWNAKGGYGYNGV